MQFSATQFRISVWYLQSFLRAFLLIFPTYAIMMQESVTPLALGVLMVIWSASRLAFEVPSGVIGDMFTRRTILLIAGLIDAVAFAVWLIWPAFAGFALGFVIWSLSIALYSGTSEAYLYEAIEDPADYERLYGRSEAMAGAGLASALLLGGYAAQSGYTLPLIASIIAPLIATLIMLFGLPHQHRRRDQGAEENPKFLTVLASGYQHIRTSRRLTLFVLIFATVPVTPWVFEEYIGVLMQELTLELVTIGYIYAGVWLARTVGSLLAHRMSDWRMTTVLLVFLAVMGFYTATTFTTPLWLVLGLLLTHFMLGCMDVVLLAKIQNLAQDHNRATIVSLASMTVELFAMSSAILFGAIAQWWSWLAAAQWCGFLGVCFTFLWLIALYQSSTGSGETHQT
ncbi:MAG: MFS transporter [Pseudomonadota bacterium]